MKTGDRVRVNITFDNIDNYSPGIARALNGAVGVVESVLGSEQENFACVRFNEPRPKLPIGPYTITQVNYWLPIRDLRKEGPNAT